MAISTRPDISNAVRAVARYCSAPKAVHWKAAIGILAHIICTSGFGITFQRGTIAGIFWEVFADADYASKATDRRSVSGGEVMCGGACLCWFSRMQKCVTLSTSEAEYVALGDAVKELLFLRHVWRFMLPGKVMPCFPFFEDRQGAVQLSQNPVSNSNLKHIDIRHHCLRELVRQGNNSMNHVPSEYQHLNESIIIRCVCDPPKFLNEFKCLMSLFCLCGGSTIWCVYVGFCMFFVCVSGCVMTQLGGCLSLVGYINTG